jgi:hypothetical protein
MAPNVIRRALEQKPFRPIRVFTGDGSTFEIKSQEFCLLSPRGRTLVIFSGGGDRLDDDEDMRLVDVFLITKIETEGNSQSFKFAEEPDVEKGK